MTAWTWVGLVSLAALLLFLSRLYHKERGLPAMKLLYPDYDSPDMRFGYTRERMLALFEGLGETGRAMQREVWLWDTGLALALTGVLAAASVNVAAAPWVRAAMIAAACLRCLMDWLENALLLRALGAWEAGRTPAFGGASLVTQAKWCLMALWVLGLFGSLLWQGMRL